MAAQRSQPGLGAKLTDTFTDYQELPLGIDEKLFATFFDHITFKEWHRRHACWQLRIIGPPGSGKTTLSALTARHLRDHFAKRGLKVGIATVFIKRRVFAGDEEFLQRFLTSVLSQLAAPSSERERSLGELSLDDLQKRLEQRIAAFERCFLIVDDVDACGRAFDVVKTELQHLQGLGLKIMVTSRIPINYGSKKYTCDAAPKIHYWRTKIYWTCRDCHARDNVHQIVCHECKADEKPCPKCGRDEYLHEPYSSVDINLTDIIAEDGQILIDFISRELEITHGDLGLGTEVEKPPESTLCAEIRSSTTNFNVYEFVAAIAEAAEFNVAMAKVRLSIAQEAQTVKELGKTRDRLPVKLIMLFEAAINRISQLPESEKILGLVALDLVSLTGAPVAFRSLEDDLVDRGLLSRDRGLDGNLSRVLHATCGLIVVGPKKTLDVYPFHHEFTQYIYDNYNEDLAQAKSYRADGIEDKSRDVCDPIGQMN